MTTINKSLFDLFNELHFVTLQAHDETNKKIDLTKHDISLDVNGVHQYLPSHPEVVDHLKWAVHASVPRKQPSDAEYLAHMTLFRKMLTEQLLTEANNLPPITVMWNGHMLQLRPGAIVLDKLDELLHAEIYDYEF